MSSSKIKRQLRTTARNNSSDYDDGIYKLAVSSKYNYEKLIEEYYCLNLTVSGKSHVKEHGKTLKKVKEGHILKYSLRSLVEVSEALHQVIAKFIRGGFEGAKTKIYGNKTRSVIGDIKKSFERENVTNIYNVSHFEAEESYQRQLQAFAKSLNEIIAGSSSVEIVQIITFCGLLMPRLRDEIYCSILNELTENANNKNNWSRAETLLFAVLSVFGPSHKILPFIANFLMSDLRFERDGLKSLLPRQMQNGRRCQPISIIEILRFMNHLNLTVEVSLMNGAKQNIVIDPLTTVNEVIQSIADQIRLYNPSGFSIYVSFEGKVSCLGFDDNKIMDTVLSSELAYLTTSGHLPDDFICRFYLRKELFFPWEYQINDLNEADVTENSIYDKADTDVYTATTDECRKATELIYCQITRGILLKEYTFKNISQLAKFLAQQYQIHNSGITNISGLNKFLRTSLTQHKLVGNNHVVQLIKEAEKQYSELFVSRSPANPNSDIYDVMWDVNCNAKQAFSMKFSRKFEVDIDHQLKDSEEYIQSTCNEQAILCINSRGICLKEEKGGSEKVINYELISSISCFSSSYSVDTGYKRSDSEGSKSLTSTIYNSSSGYSSSSEAGEQIPAVGNNYNDDEDEFIDLDISEVDASDKISLTTWNGSKYIITSKRAWKIYQLIQLMLNDLRRRSQWAITRSDVKGNPKINTLAIKKGELIRLISAKSKVLSDYRLCINIVTGERGEIHREHLTVLAVMKKPDDHLLQMISCADAETSHL